MAKTLKGGMVPGCCCLPADLWLLRGATKHWDKWTGNEKNKLQNICCLLLHNISSFLHNIWQCYNASTSYDNYSTTLICCVIITQHIQNSYTAYQYTTQHIKQSYTTNGFILSSHNIYKVLTQYISLACNIWNIITQHIASLYNYKKYTEFLHNISVHYATYEITLHDIWFHFNTKHGHMVLFLCI